MGCWWILRHCGSGIAREHNVKLLPSRIIFPEPNHFENRCNVGGVSLGVTFSETIILTKVNIAF
jgi:hypothetical protein